MKDQIFNILFIAVIVLMVIFWLAIVLIGAFEKEESKVGGLQDITGTVQNFEAYHKNTNPSYVHVRTSERYDDKYFEYLEHIKERRAKTFLR